MRNIVKTLRATWVFGLENGQQKEIILPEDVCDRLLDQVAPNVYVDVFGGVGMNVDDEFYYILGALPENWPSVDGRIQWCTAGPFDGTDPQLWAFLVDAPIPSDNVREEGQQGNGMLARVFVEEDGSFRVLLHVKCPGLDEDDYADHEIEMNSYASYEAVRAAVTKVLNDHLDGKCELVRVG